MIGARVLWWIVLAMILLPFLDSFWLTLSRPGRRYLRKAAAEAGHSIGHTADPAGSGSSGPWLVLLGLATCFWAQYRVAEGVFSEHFGPAHGTCRRRVPALLPWLRGPVDQRRAG